MASRLLRPTRHTRRACAAVGVAAFLFAGAAPAQNAGDLGLRGADAPDAAGAPAGQETTNGTGGTPPDQTQEKPKPKPSQAQLSRLQPHKGAERLDQRGVPKARSDSQARAPTVAALPAPPPRRPRQDDKPFDPLGISIGDLRLKPYIEEDIGWSSNPELVPGSQKSSAFLTSQAGFALDFRLVEQRAPCGHERRSDRLFLQSRRRCAFRQRRHQRPPRRHARSEFRRRRQPRSGDAQRFLARSRPPMSASVPPARR